MKTCLTTHDLQIGYSKEKPLGNAIDLELLDGELVCLLGPNGAGKSTLIQTLVGKIPAISGSVKLLGKSIVDYTQIELAKSLSMMNTERLNIEYIKVIEVVQMGRYPHQHWLYGGKMLDDELLDDVMASMEVLQFKDRFYNTLSDGEKQRVLIARSLAQDTKVLFFDEPTSFLDITHKVECLHLLREWARKKSKAVVLSTHDFDLAIHLADCIWFFDKHSSFYSGSPEDLMLKGVFANCFNNENIAINPNTGGLQVLTHSKEPLRVQGEQGLKRKWLEKALVRAGYKIDNDERSSKVVLVEENGFIYEDANRKEEASSILEILREIEKSS